MISDNYVTGDNIYLRELQNFFFETLGMMSVTHYGAIGDGRTDNYGPLQVAIDDANRRGLSYIYVPYGRFIYTGELINMDNITFVGNPKSHIVNIRTGEEIEIKQFGLPIKGTPKSTITAHLNEDYTLTDDMEVLSLTKYDSAGEGFSINNNGEIVVGEKISHIKIDAQITFGSVTNGTKDLIVTVGAKTRVLNSKVINTLDDKTICCASFTVPVEEGDKIRLKAGGTIGDVVKSYYSEAIYTYITVETVD